MCVLAAQPGEPRESFAAGRRLEEVQGLMSEKLA